MRLPERLSPRAEPRTVFAATVVLQLLAVVVFALATPHDGWLYFHGGDQLWYYTGAWLLGDGVLPPGSVGYAWSVLLVPLAALAGPLYLNALPALVILQVLVLVPLATVLVFLLARRIAGAWFGACAAGLWAFGPFLAIPFFDDRYHERYAEIFLPQTMGLTGLADFPSTVCVLASALFALRALERRAIDDALLCGLLAGFAIGLKPANAVFLAAPALALVAARSWRQLLAFGATIAPALITLALWTYRGLGTLPVFDASGAHVAAGSAVAALGVDRYIDLDFGHLHDNLDQLREFFWSARLLEFIPIAGTIALLRRSLPVALLVGVWFWAFLLVKGTYGFATVESGSFFRFLMPAFPAYVLLGAGLLLLVPTVGARLVRSAPPPETGFAIGRRALAVAAIVLVVLPLLAVAIPRPLNDERAILLQGEGTFVPVSAELELHATRAGDSLQLDWSQPDAGSTTVYYRLFRAEPGQELYCFEAGTRQCILNGEPFDTVVGTRHTVPLRPGVYRLGMAANWLGEKGLGETLLLGPPLVIR
jgi:hypothetical protein